MSKLVNLAFAVATVIAALLIGFLMQPTGAQDANGDNTEVALAQIEEMPPASLTDAVPGAVADETALPLPPQDKDMPEMMQLGMPVLVAAANLPLSVDAMMPMPEDNPEAVPVALDLPFALEPDDGADMPEMAEKDPCAGNFTAEPMAAAMVTLTIDAPCQAGARVTIHHSGVMFTEVLDADGRLDVLAPAFGEQAIYMAEIFAGQTYVANVEVTSMSFYDRAAVQWIGQTGLQLHALEYGADYGTDGHKWVGNAGDLTEATNGKGGFVVALGNADLPDAHIAHVYTFPTGTARTQGDVRLSVEAEVSTDNCSRSIEAQSIQYRPETRVRAQDVEIDMPECDDFGGFLVLKNLLEDLTIAAK